MRPGFKSCHSCHQEIPAACKRCNGCNADQPLRKRSHDALSIASPVQANRLTTFRYAALSSPARVRRSESLSTAPAQRGAGLATNEQALPIGSNSASSGPAPLAAGSPNTPVSPVAQAVPASDGSLLQSYVDQLKVVESRCMIIGEDSRGILCYAVAGHIIGDDGGVGIVVCTSLSVIRHEVFWHGCMISLVIWFLCCLQAKSSAHVIALPMKHACDERHYSYLCSCEDMQPGLQILQGMDSSRTSKACMSHAVQTIAF